MARYRRMIRYRAGRDDETIKHNIGVMLNDGVPGEKAVRKAINMATKPYRRRRK